MLVWPSRRWPSAPSFDNRPAWGPWQRWLCWALDRGAEVFTPVALASAIIEKLHFTSYMRSQFSSLTSSLQLFNNPYLLDMYDHGTNGTTTQLVPKAAVEYLFTGHEAIDRTITAVLGSITLACSFIGISLNLLTIQFFRKRSPVFKLKIVFGAAAYVDISISCLSIFSAASFLDNRQPLAFSNFQFCQLWGFLWSLASKLSASIVGFASLIRVLLITFRYEVATNNLKIALSVYTVVLLVIEFFPFMFNESFSYQGYFGSCHMGYVALKYLYPISFKGFILSYLPALTYLLPIPICFCSYMLSCITLCRQSSLANTRLEPSNNRNFRLQALMTLSTFMSGYLLLQAPLAVYIISYVIKLFSGSSITPDFHSSVFSFYMPHFVYLLAVAVNATINPLIYCWRLQEFRAFVEETVRRATIRFRSLRNSRKPSGRVSRFDVDEWRRQMTRLESFQAPLGEKSWNVPIHYPTKNVSPFEGALCDRAEQREDFDKNSLFDRISLFDRNSLFEERIRLIEHDNIFVDEVLALATQEMEKQKSLH